MSEADIHADIARAFAEAKRKRTQPSKEPLMDKDKLVEHHQEAFEYELENYERATEVGSPDSAERALARAADHAAILTALRSHAQKEEG